MKKLGRYFREIKLCLHQLCCRLSRCKWCKKGTMLPNIYNECREGCSLDQVSIFREFINVFPDDLPGLSPYRKIEFCIDLVPGTEPILMALYRMTLVELRELNKQLQDLLDKKFIWSSVSPWGALMLFVKKKNGSMIAHFQVKLDLFDKIKITQKKYNSLLRIRNEVE